MEPSELLHFLAGVLERLQLQYFITRCLAGEHGDNVLPAVSGRGFLRR